MGAVRPFSSADTYYHLDIIVEGVVEVLNRGLTLLSPQKEIMKSFFV